MFAPLKSPHHHTDSPAAEAEACIQVDDLQFTVRRSARRRTMQITVERTGELILSAPPDVGIAQLRDFVSEKRFWIYTKLAEKDRLKKAVPTKSYVDGEGFLYLGRSYRLRLVDEQDVALKLLNGRFMLRRDLVENARSHLVQWYSARAKFWLWDKVQDYVARMEVRPVGVKVQDLGYRWGSCGKGDWLYFHWKTILFLNCIFDIHDICLCGDIVHCDSLACERIDKDLADGGIRDTTFCCDVGLLDVRWLRCCFFFFVVVRVVVALFLQRHDEEVLPVFQKLCNVVGLCGVVVAASHVNPLQPPNG
jgi:predicted metal-dependent hydrolase